MAINVTGNGTMDDPWVVADWESFLSKCGATGYIRWAEIDDKYIDFNLINPDGYSNRVGVGANVDFNNWTFANYRYNNSGDYVFNFGNSNYFINATFDNIIINGTGFCTFGGPNVLSNVAVTGRINKNGSVYVVDGVGQKGGRIARCSFVIESGAEVGEFLTVLNGTTIDSYWKILYPGTGRVELAWGTDATNCLFKVTSPSSTVNIGHNFNISLSSNLNTNVYITKCKSLGEIDTQTIVSCIANSDLVENPFSINGLTPCTTEQMKDVEYLKSIGFPIGAM